MVLTRKSAAMLGTAAMYIGVPVRGKIRINLLNLEKSRSGFFGSRGISSENRYELEEKEVSFV